jgi:hypothetical protein
VPVTPANLINCSVKRSYHFREQGDVAGRRSISDWAISRGMLVALEIDSAWKTLAIMRGKR